MKSVVSLMCDFNLGTAPLIFSSTKAEILSVGHPFALIIGLPGGKVPVFFTL